MFQASFEYNFYAVNEYSDSCTSINIILHSCNNSLINSFSFNV